MITNDGAAALGGRISRLKSRSVLPTFARPRWCLSSDPAVRLRIWGDEAVAYQGTVDTTHLLGPSAVFILQRLQAVGAADVAGLARELVQEWQLDDGDASCVEVEGELEQVMLDLYRLRLVEAVPC